MKKNVISVESHLPFLSRLFLADARAYIPPNIMPEKIWDALNGLGCLYFVSDGDYREKEKKEGGI